MSYCVWFFINKWKEDFIFYQSLSFYVIKISEYDENVYDTDGETQKYIYLETWKMDISRFALKPSKCDMLFSLAIWSPMSDKNSACWIAIRHERVSNGDEYVNMYRLP